MRLIAWLAVIAWIGNHAYSERIQLNVAKAGEQVAVSMILFGANMHDVC